MTVTPQNFVTAYPEFRETDYNLVVEKIASAELRVQAAVWGDQRDDGVKLLTAHLIAMSPDGERARLSADSSKTLYWDEFDRLRREVTIGYGRVI